MTEITIWQDQDVPTPTPQLARSMQPQELEDHREAICFDVEAILDGYWKDSPKLEVKARIMANWADALEDWNSTQINYALNKWVVENPNKKPNHGHIVQILTKARGVAEAKRRARVSAPEQEDERQRATPEQKAAIMAEIMGEQEGIGGLKKMPKEKHSNSGDECRSLKGE